MELRDLGWDDFFAAEFEKVAKNDWVPARLITETKINFAALLADGEELDCVVGGKVWHDATCDADLPSVGDWVALEIGGGENDEHLIRARLPRKTTFSRKAPGNSSQEQVMAANVDVVVVVTDAGSDFNLRRMERYFALVSRSGAKCVVLVNKSDLFDEKTNTEARDEIRELWSDAEVHITSATRKEGLEVLRTYLTTGVTLTMVGSSGVGKSTLVNQLLGEEFLWTGEVNEVTGKGRHTTVARELVVLPEGGMLVDNPGIREVQMWTDEDTLRESFVDVEELTNQCKFRDCKHQGDRGCAIAAAVESGQLATARYEAYLHLDEEIEELNFRKKKRQMIVERWSKRNAVKARNHEDRVDLAKEDRGEL
ncbi:ribosome small subunit-dependent GTPase A [Akkermansiaceae bacterium]|nr:ribosome small subunit-dependent GTPase A [Akkermansiaceae bacterium]MDA7611628.1 ribosome small subunit-dependent GTPase A [bacterium]MDA7538411.1 ribosome small subunit-dependent GTPase A [Akkermansiaceae bacterium]MDA7649136.1 ribosome small subunit-dependent GTPase A [Akkermansiaceae bacterium]MDA7862362.1 ribosome small subunit-dependent GTPase A [Akkermansiaceae bacterium]